MTEGPDRRLDEAARADDSEPTEPIRPLSAEPAPAAAAAPAAPAGEADGTEHTRPYWPAPDPRQQAPETPEPPPEHDEDADSWWPVFASEDDVEHTARFETAEPRAEHLDTGEPGGRGGGVPRLLWPAVVALAMVVGLAGGVGGAALWDRLEPTVTDDPAAGPSVLDVETSPPLPADNGSIAAVAQQLLPSTVQISAAVGGRQGGATGSGFVLDRQGHIVTNNHVVAEASDSDGDIEILDQDGNRFPARLVGRSPVYDLAVLHVPEARDLEPAALGSSERLRIGEGVVAIGSPLGLTSTVTSGIVSALDRPVTTGSSQDEASYINAVQTDAAINPGNSGGPLVNLQGQVVGVNSAIATAGSALGEAGNIGVGFAIPVEQVRVTADQILTDGEARYPVIGAQVNTSREGQDGAPVVEVVSGTPADDAGLREGDLITAVDGDRVTDGIALIVAIRTHQPGETIPFTVQRDGRDRTVRITLGSEVG